MGDVRLSVAILLEYYYKSESMQSEESKEYVGIDAGYDGPIKH